MIELHARVFGFVQGVGFRARTTQLATKYHLTGSVRNLSDGSVELIVQGEKNILEQFLFELEKTFGPRYINKIEKSFHASKEVYKNFRSYTNRRK